MTGVNPDPVAPPVEPFPPVEPEPAGASSTAERERPAPSMGAAPVPPA